MQYAMLLKPHSNVRYRHSLEKLAMTELSCVLNAWKLPSDMELRSLGGEPFLVFSAPELTVPQWRDISANAGCCFAAELREDGSLAPLPRAGRVSLPVVGDEPPPVVSPKPSSLAARRRGCP